MFQKIEAATTKEELTAARTDLEGAFLYQRQGAEVGAVRLAADGKYVIEGACTDDDIAGIDKRYQDGIAVLLDKLAVLGVAAAVDDQ
jgi:hypothetical protein